MVAEREVWPGNHLQMSYLWCICEMGLQRITNTTKVHKILFWMIVLMELYSWTWITRQIFKENLNISDLFSLVVAVCLQGLEARLLLNPNGFVFDSKANDEAFLNQRQRRALFISFAAFSILTTSVKTVKTKHSFPLTACMTLTAASCREWLSAAHAQNLRCGCF